MTINIKGYNVLIDDEDYEKVSAKKWIPLDNSKLDHPEQVYFRSTEHRGQTFMHRYLLGLKPLEKKVVDHINSDTLDNRKCNLRICSYSENNFNRKIQRTSSTGYKGVCYNKRQGRFTARIGIHGTRFFLGYFDTSTEAYAAYCEASKKYHGEFGRLR